jgi:hypothetical protein
MGKRQSTKERIEKMIHEGRGKGEGQDYKPWLWARDASRGRSHRIKGLKTNRTHHFLSDGERNCYSLFEYSPKIKDIREQYPLLPIEATVTIAESLGIKHPMDRSTGYPVVLTSDFLLTETDGTLKARTFKYSKELTKPNVKRLLEKLEIERLYWQIKNTDWALITELELPSTIVKNIKIFLDQGVIEFLDIGNAEVTNISQWLTAKVLEKELPLVNITKECDALFHLLPGTSLKITYHLLATRQWQIDITQPFDPENVLMLTEN